MAGSDTDTIVTNVRFIPALHEEWGIAKLSLAAERPERSSYMHLWRNGRRTGLRNQRAIAHVSSTLTRCTNTLIVQQIGRIPAKDETQVQLLVGVHA